MTRARIRTAAVAEPAPGLWSNCILVDGIAYLAGMTSRANDGVTIEGRGEYEQACVVFRKFRHYLESAGGQMDDIVKLTIFVTRIGSNTEVWRARREFFSGDFPTCSLVEVSALATPEILVEIEGIAHIGSAAGRQKPMPGSNQP